MSKVKLYSWINRSIKYERTTDIVDDGALMREIEYFKKFKHIMIEFMKLKGIDSIEKVEIKKTGSRSDEGGIKVSFRIPEEKDTGSLENTLTNVFLFYVLLVFFPAMGYVKSTIGYFAEPTVSMSELNRKEVRDKSSNKLLQLMEENPEALYVAYSSGNWSEFLAMLDLNIGHK